MSSHFKVAIRIKKNSHEANLDSMLKSQGNCIQLFDRFNRNKHGIERMHSFSFDFCFDDSANQAEIYESLSPLVLGPFKEDINSCIIAYGQTGSGKTYTMLGTENDPGLIPRICEAILIRAVTMMEACLASFYEVYNEKVRDLLPHQISDSGKVRVREHPLYGPYVSGLSWHPINSVDDINLFLKTGCKARSCSLTNMHNSSSRSHAIFTIVKKQATAGHNDVFGTKLCLVDLAGSEKPKHQSTREQVKEGAHINKSLATLGNVILSLGSHMNKDYPTDKYIPYRNSTLTWLLKDSIGGAARTVMIGTVSASSAYYLETLNTLRYACKAKQIIQMPHTFGGKTLPAQSLISDLQSEIKRLRDLIEEKLPAADYLKINSSLEGSDSNKIVISRSSMTSPIESSSQNSQTFFDANMDSDESAKGLIIEHYKNKIEDLEKELKGYRSLLKETSNQDESLSDEVTFTSPRPLKFTLEKKIELLERQINEKKNQLLHEEYQEDHQNNNHQDSEELWFRDYAEPDNSPLTHSWISVDFADIDRPHRFAYSVPISFKKASRAHSLLSQTLYPKSLKDAGRPAFVFLKKQPASGSEIETQPKSQPSYTRKSILKDSVANKESQKFEKNFQHRLERSFQSPDNKVVPGVSNQQLRHTNSYHFEEASWMAGEIDSKYPNDNLEEKMSSHSDSELEPPTKVISKNAGLSQSFAHRPKEQSQFTKMKLSKSFSTKSQKSEIEKPKFSYLKRYDSSTTSWPIDESNINKREVFSNITNKDYNNHVPIEYGISFNEFNSSGFVLNNNVQLANSPRNDKTSEIIHRKPSTVYSHRFEAADKIAENLVESCFVELDKEKFQSLHESPSHSRQSAEILHMDRDSNHKAISKKMGNEEPKSFTLSDAYKNVQNSIQPSNDSGSGSECSDIGQSYKHVNFDPLNTSSATPYGSSFSSQSLLNKEVDHFSPTNFWKQNFKLNFEDDEENDNQGGTNSGNDRSRKVKKVVRARAELRRLKHGSNSSSASESSPRIVKQVEGQPALKVDEKSGFYYDEQAISDMASLNGDSLEIESDKDEKVKNTLLQSNVFYSSFTKHMDEDEESVAEEINGGAGIEFDKQNHSSDNTDYGDEWLSTPAKSKRGLSFSLSNNETGSILNPFLYSSTKSEALLKIQESSPRISKIEEDSSRVSRHSSKSPTISSPNFDNEKLNAGHHVMERKLMFPTDTINADVTAVESDTSSVDNGMTLTSSPSKEALIINVKLIQRSHGSLSEIPCVSDTPLQQCKLIQPEDKTKKDANKELRNAFKDTSQEYNTNRTQTRQPSFNGEDITIQRLLFAAPGLNEKENFIETFQTSTIAFIHSSKGDDMKKVSTPIESPTLSDSFSSDFESDSTVNEKGINISIQLHNEKKTPLKKFLPTMVAHILKPTETGLTQWVLFDQFRQNSVTTLLPKSENSPQSNKDVSFDKETNDPIKTSDMRKSSWAWTESHKSTRTLARQKFFEPIVIQEIVSEEGTDKTNSDHLKEISEAVGKPSLIASKSLSSSSGKANNDSNNDFSSSLKIHPKLFTSLEIENYDPHMYSPEDKPNLTKLSGNGILKMMEDNLPEVKENGNPSEKTILRERQLSTDEQSKPTPSRKSSNAIQSPTANTVLPSRKESWQNSKSDKILESNSSSANDEHRISFDSKEESNGSYFISSNNSLPLLPSTKTNANIHILEKLFDNLSEVKDVNPNLFTKEMPASKSEKINFYQNSTNFSLDSDIKKTNGHILKKDDDTNLLHLDEANSSHSIFKTDHSSCEHDKSESGMVINQEKLIDRQQSSHDSIEDANTGHVDIFAGRQLNRVSLVESPNKSKIKQISSPAISTTPAQNALDTLLSVDLHKKESINGHDAKDHLLTKEVKVNQKTVHNTMKSFFDPSALLNTNETQYHVHSLKKIDSSLIDKHYNQSPWPSSLTGNVLGKPATDNGISTNYSGDDTTYLSNTVFNELQSTESNKESRIGNQQMKNDIFAGRQLNRVALMDNQKDRNQCESNMNQQLITALPTKTLLPVANSTKKEPSLSQINSKEMLFKDSSQVLHGKIVDNDLKTALRKPFMEKTTENPAVHLLSKEHDYLNEGEHNKLSIEHSKLFNNISLNSGQENPNTAVNAFSNSYANSYYLKTGSDHDFHETNSNDDLTEENDIFAGRQLQRISCVQLDSNSASKLTKDNRSPETNADCLIKDVVFVHNEPYHLFFGNQTAIVKDKSPAKTASSHTLDRSTKNEKEEKEEKEEEDIFAGRELQRTAENGSRAADSKKSKFEIGLSAGPSTSKSDGQSSRSPHEIYQETLQSVLPAGFFVNSSGKTAKVKGEQMKKTETKSNHFLSTFNFDTRLHFRNEQTVSTESKNDPSSEKEKSESLNDSGSAISLHQSINNQTEVNQGSDALWNLERKPKPPSSSDKTPNFNAMIDATEQYISFLRQFLPLPTADWQQKPIEENRFLNDTTLQSYMENLHALLPFGIAPKSEPSKSQKKIAKNKGTVKAEQEFRKKFFINSTIDCSKSNKDQDLSGALHDEPGKKYSVPEESEAQRKSDNNQVESLEVKHRLPSIELKKEKRFDQGSESPNEPSYFQNLSKICLVPFASSSGASDSNSSQVSNDHKNEAASNPFVYSGVTANILSSNREREIEQSKSDKRKSKDQYPQPEDGILNVTYIDGIPHIQLQLNGDHDEYDEQFDLSIHSDEDGEEQVSDRDQIDEDIEDFDNLENIPSNHIDLDDTNADEILYYFDEKEENIVDPSSKMPLSQSLDFEKIIDNMPLSNRLSESYPTINESKFKHGLSNYHPSSSQLPSTSASRDSLKLDFKDYFNSQDMHFNEDDDSDTRRKKSVSWSDLSAGKPLEHGPGGGSQHFSPLRSIIKRGIITVEPTHDAEPMEHNNRSFLTSLTQKFNDDVGERFSNLHDSVMVSKSALNLASAALKNAYVQTDPAPLTRSVSTLTINAVDDVKRFSRDPSPSPSMSMENVKRYQTKSLLNDLMALVHERDTLLESMNSDLSEWKQPRMSYHKDYNRQYMNDQWWKLWRIKNDLDKRIEELFVKVKTHQLSELPYQHISWLNVPHSALLTCSLKPASTAGTFKESSSGSSCPKTHLSPFDYEKKLAQLRRTLVSTSNDLKQTVSYPELQTFTSPQSIAIANSDWRYGNFNTNANWTNAENRKVFQRDDESLESILREAQKVRQLSRSVLRETRESLNMPHLTLSSNVKFTPAKQQSFHGDNRVDKKIDDEIQTLRDQYRISQLSGRSNF